MSQPELTGTAGSPDGRVIPRQPPPELLARLRRGGIIFPFLVLFVVLSVASGPFFTKVNLLDILDQQASILIIAAAGTLVLIAGGIDLSVGATYALAGVTAADLTLSVPPLLAILAGVAVGLAVGLVNGVIATIFRINSLIATLAMSFVVGGLASLVTGGNLDHRLQPPVLRRPGPHHVPFGEHLNLDHGDRSRADRGRAGTNNRRALHVRGRQ